MRRLFFYFLAIPIYLNVFVLSKIFDENKQTQFRYIQVIAYVLYFFEGLFIVHLIAPENLIHEKLIATAFILLGTIFVCYEDLPHWNNRQKSESYRN